MKISSVSKHHPLHKQRRRINIPLGAQRFLAAFEGLEGGFAIGASIVVALSFADLDRSILISTAVLSVIVNGFNTASVKYSSEHYLDQLDGIEKRSPFKHYFAPAFIEFICYFAISFVFIIPLIVVGETPAAIWMSVLLTLLILAVAGYWRAYVLQMPRWRDAVETVMLGGGIIVVGLVSGFVAHTLL